MKRSISNSFGVRLLGREYGFFDKTWLKLLSFEFEGQKMLLGVCDKRLLFRISLDLIFEDWYLSVGVLSILLLRRGFFEEIIEVFCELTDWIFFREVLGNDSLMLPKKFLIGKRGENFKIKRLLTKNRPLGSWIGNKLH